jgi:hypothetical protein
MKGYVLSDLEISHDEVTMIDRLIAAHQEWRLLDEFVPCPGVLRPVDWDTDQWGTIGDIDGISMPRRIDAHTVALCFHTSLAPPIPVLDRMVQLGYRIEGSMHGEHLHVVYDNGVTAWIEGDTESLPESVLEDTLGLGDSIRAAGTTLLSWPMLR